MRGCRVYQYLFKPSLETIPYQTYQNPVVNSATENRIAYLEGKPFHISIRP